MAQAPRTIGHRTPREHRPNAYHRGYATKRYQRMRRAYLRDIVHETGDMVCALCGRSMLNAKPKDITIDHITPAYQYGPVGSAEYEAAFFDTDNWQPAHRSCNSAKQDRQ